MKKLSFMYVKEQQLTRDEMKHIMAGSGMNCRVAYRNVGGSFIGYSQCMDCNIAADMYHGSWYDNDSLVYVSGYCGSSCGSGSFSNTQRCY